MRGKLTRATAAVKPQGQHLQGGRVLLSLPAGESLASKPLGPERGDSGQQAGSAWDTQPLATPVQSLGRNLATSSFFPLRHVSATL